MKARAGLRSGIAVVAIPHAGFWYMAEDHGDGRPFLYRESHCRYKLDIVEVDSAAATEFARRVNELHKRYPLTGDEQPPGAAEDVHETILIASQLFEPYLESIVEKNKELLGKSPHWIM